MATKIAINGFGRIGRCILRAVLARKEKDLEIVAINDLDKPAALAHLFKYDSVHRTWPGTVKATEKGIVIDGQEHRRHRREGPDASCPGRRWAWTSCWSAPAASPTREGAEKHLDAGAKKVIISAPAKGPDLTIAYGINHDQYDPKKHHIISNASCTTNCLAPVAKVLLETFGIEKGLMTTIHSYTNDQRILDLPHEDLRRARAAALSMIPTTTGAAKAIGEVLPALKGKLDGTVRPRADAERVAGGPDRDRSRRRPPRRRSTPRSRRPPRARSRACSSTARSRPSRVDYNGNPHSAIFDATNTFVIDGNLVKVMAWYDNEWGFSNRMVDTAKLVASKG